MPYTIPIQAPEAPIREQWIWESDLTTSYDGSEDRIPLTRYPRRSFSGQYEFDNVADIRRHMAFMVASLRNEFGFPLYQYQVKLKAPVSGGDTILVNTLRSDFRVGGLALVIEGDTFQLLTVASFDADSVTFEEALGAYSARALACPVTGAYSAAGAGISRRNPDGSGSASFDFTEATPLVPFVPEFNETELTMYDGLAVLEQPAIGNQFDRALDNGMVVVDYTAGPDFFSPLAQSQWAFPTRFLVNRILDNNAWLWWQVFADYVQGSSTPFLLPTFREDLEIITPATGSGTTVVVKGHEYSEHYFALDTYKRIVIDTAAGRRYRKVTAVADVGGNDQLTFTPALPAGAGWAQEQSIGFLQRVRISDDKVVCDHYGLHTEVSLTLRTVE